ncbi:hypothetical protein C8R42DRAFT_575468 [Lentinula raphanica]|nr:hypothetical protein C8R42DRAFT_575468 [Lentinula raphanica]
MFPLPQQPLSSFNSAPSNQSTAPSLSILAQTPQLLAPSSHTHILPSNGLPDRTAFPPPPSQCRPYSSLQMLANLGSAQSSSVPVGTHGHPRVTSASGFPSMTAISRSNQARLDHASTSLPRTGGRRRGRAVRPPSISQSSNTPTIRDCISMAEGGIEVANIDLLVYPPMPPTTVQNRLGLPRHPYIYKRNAESFKLVLTKLGLYFEFNHLPISTPIYNILAHAVAQIRKHYNAEALPDLSIPLPSHERLPLQLLAFTNRGRANGIHMTPRLTTTSFPSTTTLQDLLLNTRDFAIERWSVTHQNHFQIHAIIRTYPFEVQLSLSDAYLGEETAIHTHHCLSKRIYKMFAHDSDANLQFSALDEEDMEDSCDELDSEEENSDEVWLTN